MTAGYIVSFYANITNIITADLLNQDPTKKWWCCIKTILIRFANGYLSKVLNTVITGEIKSLSGSLAVSKQDSSYPTNDGSSCYQKMVSYNESRLVILKFIP